MSEIDREVEAAIDRAVQAKLREVRDALFKKYGERKKGNYTNYISLSVIVELFGPGMEFEVKE